MEEYDNSAMIQYPLECQEALVIPAIRLNTSSLFETLYSLKTCNYPTSFHQHGTNLSMDSLSDLTSLDLTVICKPSPNPKKPFSFLTPTTSSVRSSIISLSPRRTLLVPVDIENIESLSETSPSLVDKREFEDLERADLRCPIVLNPRVGAKVTVVAVSFRTPGVE